MFNEIVKEKLKMKNLSPQEFSALHEISYQRFYRVLNGGVPTDEELLKICKGLDIEIGKVDFENLNISVTEAARIMGKSPNFVKAMVKNGVFGHCDGTNYHIPRKKFEQYMGLLDTSESVASALRLLAYSLQNQ